jgi:hypothetical protein
VRRSADSSFVEGGVVSYTRFHYDYWSDNKMTTAIEVVEARWQSRQCVNTSRFNCARDVSCPCFVFQVHVIVFGRRRIIHQSHFPSLGAKRQTSLHASVATVLLRSRLGNLLTWPISDNFYSRQSAGFPSHPTRAHPSQCGLPNVAPAEFSGSLTSGGGYDECVSDSSLAQLKFSPLPFAHG